MNMLFTLFASFSLFFFSCISASPCAQFKLKVLSTLSYHIYINIHAKALPGIMCLCLYVGDDLNAYTMKKYMTNFNTF